MTTSRSSEIVRTLSLLNTRHLQTWGIAPYTPSAEETMDAFNIAPALPDDPDTGEPVATILIDHEKPGSGSGGHSGCVIC